MRTFRVYSPDQRLLLPPSLQDWLPEGHLARFISDVVDELNLASIFSAYERGDGRGQPPYHPSMMVKLLVYAYCTGKPSSRKIEEATYTDVAFRVLSADQHPDHAVISEFRKRHLRALASLFKDVLELCEKAGLVKLGHVAIDGTKIKANASRHKAMSYERMEQSEKRLEEEIAALLKRAEEVDAAEDAQYGPEHRGDELPAELARRDSRLKVIREAKKALEEEAREQAKKDVLAAEERIAQRRQQEAETGKKAKGHDPKTPDPEQATPKPKAQRNFTDPESRIMIDGATKSFMQAYNAQAAVDAERQIIIAAEITDEANDKKQLVPMALKAELNSGRMPETISADSGYFSEIAVTDQALEGVGLYVAVDRQKHNTGHNGATIAETAIAETAIVKTADPTELTPKEKMRQKLLSEAGKKVYALRKTIVEPVFGQIKEARGFRRFSFRGKEKVGQEWSLICLTHNLLKLYVNQRGKRQPVKMWREMTTKGVVGLQAA